MADSQLYFIALTDKERELVELWSYNWYQRSGRAMKIPPALFEDLQSAGVRMKYFESDPNNEYRGLVDDMRRLVRPDLQHPMAR